MGAGCRQRWEFAPARSGMDRLSILCFAGTYSLALASDLARLIARNRAAWYLAVGLTALGWGVQGLYLANLAWTTRHFPVATLFESLLVLAWILAAIDLYLAIHAAKPVAVGLFVLPIVIGLVTFAWVAKEPSSAWAWSGWDDRVAFWGTVHGVFLLLGAVSACTAFAAGLMYLRQSHRLKHKLPPRTVIPLPSLEESEKLNRAAISAAFPLLSCGLLIGLALNIAARGASGGPLEWTDPKILSALVMWLVFAVLLHVRYRPAMRGRRVAAWTIVAFAFLVFTWSISLLLPSAHGGSKDRRPAPDSGARAGGVKGRVP